jgi:hypothetical protein
LKIHINHFSVLIYGSPKVVLLAIDFDEDLIDIKGIAVASVLAFQSSSIDSSEFDAPELDRLSSDGDASFG